MHPERAAAITQHDRPAGWRRATLAAAIVLALAAGGCSDGADGRDSEINRRVPVSAVDYGKRAVDVGDPRELNRLANLYATLQRRFQAGDMAGVCVRVSPHLLEQFPPNGSEVEGSCESQLTAYARALHARNRPRSKLKIDWLRIYTDFNIGGITATDSRGRSVRVPFQHEDNMWKLRLGVFARPDTLNGTLVR